MTDKATTSAEVDFLQRLAGIDGSAISQEVLGEIQEDKKKKDVEAQKRRIQTLLPLVAAKVKALRDTRKTEKELLVDLDAFEKIGQDLIAGTASEKLLEVLDSRSFVTGPNVHLHSIYEASDRILGTAKAVKA